MKIKIFYTILITQLLILNTIVFASGSKERIDRIEILDTPAVIVEMEKAR